MRMQPAHLDVTPILRPRTLGEQHKTKFRSVSSSLTLECYSDSALRHCNMNEDVNCVSYIGTLDYVVRRHAHSEDMMVQD